MKVRGSRNLADKVPHRGRVLPTDRPTHHCEVVKIYLNSISFLQVGNPSLFLLTSPVGQEQQSRPCLFEPF